LIIVNIINFFYTWFLVVFLVILFNAGNGCLSVPKL